MSSRNIPFFNYPGLFAERKADFLTKIEDVLSRGAYIMQRDLTEFESSIGAFLGVRHVLGVADGTVALTMALRLARIGPGDEVIVPSHTFIATAAAVHHVGATPVLCDCGPDHMIDVASAATLVTAKTKAIMPVQLNGRTCDMIAVAAFAEEHGLNIVEDSCQALGARFRGRPAGMFGVAGSFSFYPAKVLGCFGDGGALILEDDDLAAEARQFRDHGRNPDTGKVELFGANARLDNLQAAIMNVKFETYANDIERRRSIARIYGERLSSCDQLALPPSPDSDPERFDVFQNYEIRAEQRDALRTHLADVGVGTIIQWGGNMIHQFEKLGLRHNAPFAEKISKTFMMLPLHHLLPDDDVHYVCDQVIAFYQGKSA
jgi:dTDP-4-amino-4,6-dideoxygalactose transaminase